MNDQAQKHLSRAEGFLERGDEFYGKAADEIIAAQKADHALTNAEIGARFGRSKDWVRTLVTWRTTDASSIPTPYSGQADEVNLRKTKQMLREAPDETVGAIIASLPAERVATIVTEGLAATGVTRAIASSPKASAAVIRASGKVSEENEAQARSRGSRGGAKDTLGVLALVLGDLLGAKRRLRDSYTAAREHDLTDDQSDAVREVLDGYDQIVDWYRSYLDSGDQSFETELQKLLAD